MGKYILVVLTVIVFIICVAAGIKWVNNNPSYNGIATTQANSEFAEVNQSGNNHLYAQNLLKQTNDQPVKEFTLIAIQTTHSVSQNIVVPVYSFNGIVPGPEIRVNQGDFVRIKVINSLSEPVTVHWHGYPVLSAMDGVPGITQDPVKPGETFIYEFNANTPGSYWYYSPMKTPDQVEGRLYGALIVQPTDKPIVNLDCTLIIEEWGPKTAGLNDASKSILTINGHTTDNMQPLAVNKGESVRLRLINAGRFPHGIHVPGQILKVVSIDGSDITNASEFSNQIVRVSPGERVDIEFLVTCNESFIIDSHDDISFVSTIKIPFKVLDGNNLMQLEPPGIYPVLDFSTYGISPEKMTQSESAFTDSVTVDLTSKLLNGSIWHFVGGKSFASQKPVVFEQGAYVKLVLTNNSEIPHTFHVHGHRFNILSINGKPFASSIQKDIVLVNPGDSYILAMRATNPGTWIMNCTVHGHGETVQLGTITYKNYISNYQQSITDQRQELQISQE